MSNVEYSYQVYHNQTNPETEVDNNIRILIIYVNQYFLTFYTIVSKLYSKKLVLIIYKMSLMFYKYLF